MEMHKTELME